MTVSTIFAQAHELGPFLDPGALIEGDYKVTDDHLNGIAFTDVGAAALESIHGLGAWGSINGTKVDAGPFRWDIVLKTEGLTVTIKAKLLHEENETAESLALAFHLDGDKEVMSRFCQSVFQNLGRSPLDGMDWETLERITNKTREEMSEMWGDLIMPISSEHVSVESSGARIKENVAAESIQWDEGSRPRRIKESKALESARRKLEEKKQISIHINVGSKLYREKRYRDAIDEWEKILLIDPNHEKTKEAISFAQQKLDEESKDMARPPKKKVLIKRNCPKCSEPLEVSAIRGQPARFKCRSCGFKGAFKPRSKRLKRIVKPKKAPAPGPSTPPEGPEVVHPVPTVRPAPEEAPMPAHRITPPIPEEPPAVPEPEPIPEPSIEETPPIPEPGPAPEPSIEEPLPAPIQEAGPISQRPREPPKKKVRLMKLRKKKERPTVVRLSLDEKPEEPKDQDEKESIPPPSNEIEQERDEFKEIEDEIASDQPEMAQEYAQEGPPIEETPKKAHRTKDDWVQEQEHIKDEIHDLMSSLHKEIPHGTKGDEGPSELFDGLDDLVGEEKMDGIDTTGHDMSRTLKAPIEDEPVTEQSPGPAISAETIDGLYATAKRLGDGGLYYEALKYIDQILSVDPKHTRALNDKGVILWNIGDMNGALSQYERTLEVDPSSIEAHVNMGVALGRLGNREKALKSFDEAIGLDASCSEAWLSKGSTLFAMEQYDDAAQCFTKVTQLEANDPEAWFGLGFSKEKVGDFEAALDSYDKVLSLDPSNVDARRGREVCIKEIRRDMLKNWLQ